jgi:hypothetical protein
MEVEDHRQLMVAAIARDRDGQEKLFTGDAEGAASAFAKASDLYRRSWEAAPPASYGRLVGMLKSAVLAGGGADEAAYGRSALGHEGGGSPPAAYAQALAALIAGDDEAARRWGDSMRAGGDAFARTAEAIGALARGDRERYAAAVAEIVRDFERRTDHLTGVAVADTALMLQALAVRRGIVIELDSPVLPASPLAAG